jgi:Skp family chaperone for outer membrane proteins
LYFNTNYSWAYSDQNIGFADIDLVIQTTNIGNSTLKKIETLNNSNVDKLKEFEKELKNNENQINQKKNLISSEEYEKEVLKFKNRVKDFKDKKNKMVINFNQTKQNELNNLFKKINPVIQNYMNENSIGILLNSKNIFIGSKKLDITQNLINEINNKIK